MENILPSVMLNAEIVSQSVLSLPLCHCRVCEEEKKDLHLNFFLQGFCRLLPKPLSNNPWRS
jgi:hypothetical protein